MPIYVQFCPHFCVSCMNPFNRMCEAYGIGNQSKRMHSKRPEGKELLTSSQGLAGTF